MDNIVETDNISKSYGDVKAIKDVSFNVKEGEFFALLGPSGCGKTTILRILGGFIEQDSGTVFIDGKDMKGIPPNKRNTSMVFQDLALFPHMNVRDNIIYGLKKKRTGSGIIEKKFKRIVDILGLSGFEGPDIRLEVDSPGLGAIRMEIKNNGIPYKFKKSDTLSFYWDFKDGIVLYGQDPVI